MKLNKKTIFAVFALFIVALSMSCVAAEDTGLNDPTNDVTTPTTWEVADNADTATVQGIVDNAKEGDTIKFAENGNYSWGLKNDVINVNKTLKFEGNNANITCQDGFFVQASSTTTIQGTTFNGFNFYNPSTTWNGRAIEVRGGSDINITNCKFLGNGNAAVYLRGSVGNLLVANCYFTGTTNATTITPAGKGEVGTKCINIMGGNGVRVINNTVVGSALDAFSIASNSKNILVDGNNITGAYYGIYYGGGLENITTTNNRFEDIRCYGVGLVKAAQTSVIENNTFIMSTLPESGKYNSNAAIYMEQGNTAHGAATKIGDITIKNNSFEINDQVPENQTTYAVEIKSEAGPLKLNGPLAIENNTYEKGVDKFIFIDGSWNLDGDDISIPQASMESTITPTDKAASLEAGASEAIQLAGADSTILPNQQVTLTISKDGSEVETRVLTTDKMGIINLENNLTEGTYDVTAKYDGATVNGVIYEPATATFTVTSTGAPTPAIAKPVIVGSNMTLVTKTGNKFTILLKDENNQLLVNQKVNFTICLEGSKVPKTYTLTTDENGVAGLNINLMMGKWNMKISCAIPGCEEVSEDFVLTSIQNEAKIIAPSMTVTTKGQAFKAQLVDQAGQALANQKVTIHVGSAQYTRTTDANGEVSLPINLANNKLYNFFLSFAGTSLYKACTAGSQVTTKY